MRETLETQLLKRIDGKRGDLFRRSDFADLGGYDQVGRVLRQLVQEGRLMKIGIGLYSRAVKSAAVWGPFKAEVKQVIGPGDEDGERLLAVLRALANAHRLRIIATLSSNGRTYFSQLARDMGISRSLLHQHLKKLETAGLVSSKLELLHGDGTALNYLEVAEFAIELTPSTIAKAAMSLPDPSAESDHTAD